MIGHTSGRWYRGVTWDEQRDLVIHGTSYEDADAAARDFYSSVSLHEVNFPKESRNVMARMRHRFGRNGHGWPD